MSKHSATSSVLCHDAVDVRERLARHLADHDITVDNISDRIWMLSSMYGQAEIVTDGPVLHMNALAPDAESIIELKYLLASHVGEFNEAPSSDIIWVGDGEEIASLPYVRSISVVDTTDLSPQIRRITFRTNNVKRFDSMSALHVKLLLPQHDRPLYLPRLLPTGLIDWGPEAARSHIRKYTIRRIDLDAGLIDIDFFLHSDGGPGSRFAELARTGDVIGMIGPGGGSARIADWMMFAGDETALPAIARMLEKLPSKTRGKAFIEIGDARDELLIDHNSKVEIVWINRRASAQRDLLAKLVGSVEIPEDCSTFAWAGLEFSSFKSVRSDWRSSRRLAKNQQLAVSYWRKGRAQT